MLKCNAGFAQTADRVHKFKSEKPLFQNLSSKLKFLGFQSCDPCVFVSDTFCIWLVSKIDDTLLCLLENQNVTGRLDYDDDDEEEEVDVAGFLRLCSDGAVERW
jgi:hypothetical protein